MIEKLKCKIFILIMVSLSIIVVGIILLFAILNCTNTIASSRMNIERLTKINEGPSYQNSLIKPEIQNFIREENEKVNYRIKNVVIFSILLSGISIIIIYNISKKVSAIIVKPVYETFERQKQFVSDASHELKTPLSVIKANSEVLESEIGENKWLKYIENETENMDKLINELLLLAKTENIEETKSYENINLSKETEISIALFESIAYEKQIKINSYIQPDIFMKCNRQDIVQILSTLIDNAIKHSEKNASIEIDLAKEKNNIVLQIKNQGDPIPKDQQDKIFERFYRIDKARNRNEKRYGLGLAIAKAGVEKYNGKIEVECKNGITSFKVII